MEDREKLIAGIVVAVILGVIGFFVIRGLVGKKTGSLPSVKQTVVPTPIPTIGSTPAPTIFYRQSDSMPHPTGTTYRYYTKNSVKGSGTPLPAQSGITQTQTLPNGMTQSQNL